MKKIIFFSIMILYFIPSTISPQSSFGQAVDFDGDGDYANTFNSPYLPTVNGTLEAWVKVRNIVPPGNIGDVFVAKNEEQWNNGDFYVFFEYSTGLLKSRIQAPPSTEIDVRSNNNFWQNLDTWFHYAFTWGSGGMKMYINGVLQTNQNNLTYSALNNTYNLYVGAHGYMLHNGSYVVSEFFDGQIDELRVWNYQKNSQQIIALKDAPLDAAYYNTIDSGLVGYWRFDVLEDLGINNDGTDDVRDFSVLHNHLDLAGDAHLVPYSTTTTTLFEKTYGGLNSEWGIVIDKTSDGGFIIGGSTASFSASQDMYVIKLDSSASIQWSKVYNSQGSIDRIHGIKQTPDGGYYISGYIEGGFGFVDHVMMKINSSGNIVWAKNFGGVEAEELRKLTITPGGGLLVAGYNASFGFGAKEVQAIKLSSNGNIDWAKTYGTLYEDFNSSCIVASDGNYVLSGAVDITGGYGIRPTLIKLDTLGNIIWAKYYSGYIEDWGRDLVETPDGGFLIAGDTRSYGLGGSQDIYLIKTNSNGDVEWARSYGGIGSERGYSVLHCSDGKYIVAGYTNSFGFGGYDGLLMKVDSNGNLEWFHTYGGYSIDYLYNVLETQDNGLVAIGKRSSNTLGGDDVWLIKTNDNGYSNCAFGIYGPNVFTISNLQAINLNMGTVSNISEANLTLTTLTPNSGETTSCAIIPVELKSFNYEIENNKVILHWTTATEINNLGFEIERSTEDIEWRNIGFAEGKGTTTEIQVYMYVDDLFGINSEKVFYRLKQIDFDGQFNYSPEIEVELQIQPDEFNLYQNYPNPFNPRTVINFSIPKSGHVSLIIYDSLGRQVLKLVDEVKDPGYYQVEFDAANLPSGIYFYSLLSGQYSATKKMALIK